MDWKKAKNYTILFLLALNIMLFTLNLIKLNKYNLSQGQKKAINTILNNNNISIKSEIPDNFKPMPQIILKSPTYDTIELQNIFFNNINDIKRTEEFEKTIFSIKNESLTIDGNYALYENKNTSESFQLNEKNALKKIEKCINTIEKKFDTFKLSNMIENENYITFQYDQSYIDNIIFNNNIIFTVYSDGSFTCSLSYFEPVHITGDKSDICSADEALFSFYKEIKNTIDENAINIIDMDLGYFIEDYAQNDSEITAVPHYRIFIDGVDEPYYINAYNNSMIYK